MAQTGGYRETDEKRMAQKTFFAQSKTQTPSKAKGNKKYQSKQKKELAGQQDPETKLIKELSSL